MKNHLKATLTVAAIMSLGLGTLVLDSGTRNVHAEETEVNVNVPVTLAITSHTPTVNIDASNPNQFYTGTASIVSTTNNPTGYTLTMADKDTNTDLVNPDYDSSTTPASFAGTIGSIASIASPITVDGTGSNFTVNKWGYAKESATTTFLPIPASTAAEEVKKTDAPAETSTATVTFGTKINKDLVSGEYSDTVVFSLTANAIPPKKLSDLTSMQQLAEYPEACTNTTVGVSADIPDARDNTTYKIAKLADGKCWMLDNLALDLTNSTILNAMDQDNTNASNTTLGYLRNGGGTTSDKYAITGVVNWTDSPTYASSYSYSDPLVNLADKDIIPSDATSTAGNHKVGGHYNFCAATAGSYCYGNGTSEGTTSGDATEDICPAGWRLPTGSTSGEFQTLYSNSSYNTYANYRAALHLPLSGYFLNGSPNDQGSNGYWWSSTRYHDNYMYRLYVGTSDIYPAFSSTRAYGYSIRCISS